MFHVKPSALPPILAPIAAGSTFGPSGEDVILRSWRARRPSNAPACRQVPTSPSYAPRTPVTELSRNHLQTRLRRPSSPTPTLRIGRLGATLTQDPSWWVAFAADRPHCPPPPPLDAGPSSLPSAHRAIHPPRGVRMLSLATRAAQPRPPTPESPGGGAPYPRRRSCAGPDLHV